MNAEEGFVTHFASMMTSMVRCMRAGVVVVYMSHATQHFPLPYGWYSPRGNPKGEVWKNVFLNNSCRNIANHSVDIVDRKTRWLRNDVLANRTFDGERLALVPPPWENVGRLACSSARRLAPDTRPLYFIPLGDLTFDLAAMHFMKKTTTRSARLDCTHSHLHLDLFTPIADGSRALRVCDRGTLTTPAGSAVLDRVHAPRRLVSRCVRHARTAGVLHRSCAPTQRPRVRKL